MFGAIIKIVLKAIAVLLLAAISFLSFAVLLGWASVAEEPELCETPTTIYLQHSFIHADFVFPVEHLSEKTRSEIQLPVDANYFVIGIGDRDIYVNTPTWADLKARYAFKALFVPSRRTMHVEPENSVGRDWVPLTLCDNQLDALEGFVMESFSRDADGKIEQIPDMTYTGEDRFYEARGTYMFYNTCNNWANKALKEAGQKTSVWAPFSQGIVYHAKKNARKNGH